MKKEMKHALMRDLTAKEIKYIDWLESLDQETKDTFERLFQDLFRAGQADYYKALNKT